MLERQRCEKEKKEKKCVRPVWKLLTILSSTFFILALIFHNNTSYIYILFRWALYHSVLNSRIIDTQVAHYKNNCLK